MEKQLMGTASVISDGVLGINFPAYRKKTEADN
jgi:hypothetical protein